MISRIIQTSVDVIRLSFRLRLITLTSRPKAEPDNIDRGHDNSWYHAQPNPTIVYYHTDLWSYFFVFVIKTLFLSALVNWLTVF